LARRAGLHGGASGSRPGLDECRAASIEALNEKEQGNCPAQKLCKRFRREIIVVFEASAAPLALAILPRLGPVGQRLPNAKAISYSIFLSHGKSLLSPIVDLPKL
jgi:hypothetical protein